MIPSQLHFSLGSCVGPCHEVEWRRGQLLYRHAVGAYLWTADVALTPDLEAWARFWRNLETAGVWHWQPHYDNPDLLYGTQWTLTLKHHECGVRSDGSNAYPGSPGPDYSCNGEYARLLKALRQLTGQPALRK